MSQKIKYISIKNYKGIDNIETNVPSRFIAILGQNGAGKTSFLEAIKTAIKVEKGGHQKVKIGEENGEIIVEFDDFKIKRIVGGNGKLEVIHNGELISKPQARLDHIFLGTIGDPHKFLSFRNSEKVSYILSTHGKKEQFDILEDERKKLYDDRTNTHRTLLAKKEEIDKTDVTSFEGIDILGLQKKLEECKKQLSNSENINAEYVELKARIDKGSNLIEQKKETLTREQAQLELIEKQISSLLEQKSNTEQAILTIETDIITYKSSLNDLQDVIGGKTNIDLYTIKSEIDSINNQIAESTGINAKREVYQEYVEAKDGLQEIWDDLDCRVKSVQEKQNVLIEDIEIGYKLKIEDGVMMANDEGVWIPIDDLNKAKQLEIGVDVCLNGPNKIKIITIEDANALDPKTLEKIKKKIEGYDAQCFLETVYNTGYESIILEDGVLAK